MQVRFWGVRGSVPVPGPSTLKIGGNTSCVEVLCGDTRLIFDAGTGIRELGNALTKQSAQALTMHMFLSHVHWDHIQGFPFFAPAFAKVHTIHMYGQSTAWGSVESSLAGQMNLANFPLTLADLPSTLVFHDMDTSQVITLDNGATISAFAGNHPGGVFLYRVDYKNKSVVYATDNEMDATPAPGLVEFVKGADVLICDSMYTPDEYSGVVGPNKKGWGHSTYTQSIELAKLSGAKQLVLFHHDPDRGDDAVLALEKHAKQMFAGSIAAYEGLSITLA